MSVLSGSLARADPLFGNLLYPPQKLERTFITQDRTFGCSLRHRDDGCIMWTEELIFYQFRVVDSEVPINWLIFANSDSADIIIVVPCMNTTGCT